MTENKAAEYEPSNEPVSGPPQDEASATDVADPNAAAAAKSSVDQEGRQRFNGSS